MSNFDIQFMHDDPDVLARSRFEHKGKKYDITVITAATGSLENKYLPEVIPTDPVSFIVAFDGEYFEQQVNAAVAQAQEELEELGNTTDYPNHIGSAAASIMSLYLNRAFAAVKKHLNITDVSADGGKIRMQDFFWSDE
tara:strand:+ start:1456 stop:1872 length:417 start_codon:yes stop_codon:yes gene_type:complete